MLIFWVAIASGYDSYILYIDDSRKYFSHSTIKK